MAMIKRCVGSVKKASIVRDEDDDKEEEVEAKKFHSPFKIRPKIEKE